MKNLLIEKFKIYIKIFRIIHILIFFHYFQVYAVLKILARKLVNLDTTFSKQSAWKGIKGPERLNQPTSKEGN